jgi:hypothetical protein
MGWGCNWGLIFSISLYIYIEREKWSLHSFLITTPQQADVADNILLFFYKKKRKQNKNNNKILQVTSACCGTVVKNECRDHFSYIYIYIYIYKASTVYNFIFSQKPHRNPIFRVDFEVGIWESTIWCKNSRPLHVKGRKFLNMTFFCIKHLAYIIRQL